MWWFPVKLVHTNRIKRLLETAKDHSSLLSKLGERGWCPDHVRPHDHWNKKFLSKSSNKNYWLTWRLFQKVTRPQIQDRIFWNFILSKRISSTHPKLPNILDRYFNISSFSCWTMHDISKVIDSSPPLNRTYHIISTTTTQCFHYPCPYFGGYRERCYRHFCLSFLLARKSSDELFIYVCQTGKTEIDTCRGITRNQFPYVWLLFPLTPYLCI